MTVHQLRLDLLDRLTVTELDLASRMLKEDIVQAVTQGTAGRWKGLALLAYMTAKHTDPTARLADFMALDAGDLVDTLNRLAGTDALVDELDAAEAELAALQAAQGDPDEALRALKNDEGPNPSVSANESSAGAGPGEPENPTRPPSGSSSPGPGALTPTPSPA